MYKCAKLGFAHLRYYCYNKYIMRSVPIITDRYYHVLGRGNNKQNIFKGRRDYIRFLFLIIYLQSPEIFKNIDRQVSYFSKNFTFNLQRKEVNDIIKKRYVEIIGFSLMSNHFHIIIRQTKDGGISKYMQRILTSYSKYFNTKYDQVGHLFQGPYKAIEILDDNQLSYLSAYQHRNARELREWKNKELEYPWSSYQDYVKENRWGDLLKNGIIIDMFENGKDYNEFVKNSGAKELFFDE